MWKSDMMTLDGPGVVVARNVNSFALVTTSHGAEIMVPRLCCMYLSLTPYAGYDGQWRGSLYPPIHRLRAMSQAARRPRAISRLTLKHTEGGVYTLKYSSRVQSCGLLGTL